MLRHAAPEDTPALVALAVSTGLFQPHEADALLRNVLDALHAGRLGHGHHAEVWIDHDGGPPVGWVYFSPEATADHVWVLWWIGVTPTRHGQGVGDALLHFVEAHVQNAEGRLLLIETSALPALDRSRAFYAKRGYVRCGCVPDYYAEGDDKIIFVKRMMPPAEASS